MTEAPERELSKRIYLSHKQNNNNKSHKYNKNKSIYTNKNPTTVTKISHQLRGQGAIEEDWKGIILIPL